MLRTYSYQGTTGKNQGGISYLYMSFNMDLGTGVITLQKIKINPPQSGTTSYTVYLNIFEKDSMQYLGSSTNAIRTTDTQNNYWLFTGDILLQSNVTYLLTFSQQPSQELSGLSVTRTELWPIETGWKCSASGSYPGSEIAYFPGIEITGEDYEEPKIEGSIKVGRGYYNADGTNIIKFEKAMEKTLSDISGAKGYKNNIVLTLDNSEVSDFVLQGVAEGTPQGYVLTKNLSTNVYLNNNKDSIFGTESKEGLEVSYTSDAISVEKGYAYIDETEGSLQIPSQEVYPAWTPQEFVVHGEDFEDKEIQEKVYNEPEVISQGSYWFEKVDGILSLSDEYTSVYQSTNKGYHSTNAISKIVFNEPGEVTIWINSYAEGGYDFTILSPMDATSALTSESGSLINTRGFQYDPRKGLSTAYWRQHTATIPDDGVPHHFWITFRKDGSSSSNDDRGYFVVKKNFSYAPVNAKQGYLSLGKVEGETKLIATGMRNPTKEYTGSSVTPADLEKKVILSEDLTEIKSVEEA